MTNPEQQFLEETAEILGNLEHELLKLDHHRHDQGLYDQIFRELHTVKGTLYMFDRKQLGDLAHTTESVFEEFKSVDLPLSDEVIQLSFSVVDFIRSTMHLSTLTEGEHIAMLDTLSQSIVSACDDALKHITDRKRLEEVQTSIFFVRIEPQVEIKQEDGHPVHFIVRDLLEDCQALRHMGVDDEKTIAHWNFLFISNMGEEELRALFLFIESDIRLEIKSYALPGRLKDGISLESYSNELQLDDPKALDLKLQKLTEDISDSSVEGETGKQDQRKASAWDLEASFIKVERGKVDSLMNWVSELVTLQATLQNEAETLQSETLRHIADSLDFMTENLRDTIFSISLVPLKSLETRFTRLVRDLSTSLGKSVAFESTGFETELDKKVITNLTDPLLHIIRNCIDHGIETPEDRISQGKPKVGTIHLKSYYSGNLVFLEITDDGAGIDPDKIRTKATEKGLIQAGHDYTDEEIIQFIFHPGLSTAEEVSDVSGRGVGMDVVKRKIQELRGEVAVTSELGRGTKTSIKLPLSLSILEGLLTKVGTTNLVIPLNTIREVHRVERDAFYNRPKGSDILEIEGRQMSVVSIEEKYQMESSKSETVDVITVDVGSHQKGVAVDQIQGQIKAVLKPIGDYYEKQDFISGGTILGDGKLAFVLDMEKIIN